VLQVVPIPFFCPTRRWPHVTACHTVCLRNRSKIIIATNGLFLTANFAVFQHDTLGITSTRHRRVPLLRVNWLQFSLVYNTSAKKHGFTTNLLRRNNIAEYDTLKIQRSRSQKKNTPNRAFGKFCLITTLHYSFKPKRPGWDLWNCRPSGEQGWKE
jgi:hypothetical protein